MIELVCKALFVITFGLAALASMIFAIRRAIRETESERALMIGLAIYSFMGLLAIPMAWNGMVR